MKPKRKNTTVIRESMPVNPKDFAPGREYLYCIYEDAIELINKLEDVCVYMEYSQPWSDKKGARQVGDPKPHRK